jgi:hypothetical protein
VLDYCHITEKGGKDIAESLKENSTLTYLSLLNNYLKSEGTIEIAKGLERNSTLLYLDLRGNQIGGGGIYVLMKCLSINTTLTHLCLSSFWDIGYEVLNKSLIKNPNSSLQSLDVSRSCERITSCGFKALVECLKLNPRLSDVKIHPEAMTVEQLHVVASLLEINKKGLNRWRERREWLLFTQMINHSLGSIPSSNFSPSLSSTSKLFQIDDLILFCGLFL